MSKIAEAHKTKNCQKSENRRRELAETSPARKGLNMRKEREKISGLHVTLFDKTWPLKLSLGSQRKRL